MYFIDASSADTIYSDLSRVAEAKGRGADVPSALRWFVEERSRWLIIFDNADDPSVNLHEYFPPCTHGNILITTRNHDVTRHATPGFNSCFHVSTMGPEDSVLLLLKAAQISTSNISPIQKKDANQLTQVCLCSVYSLTCVLMTLP